MTDFSTYGSVFSIVSGSVVTPVAGVTEIGDFEFEKELVDTTSHDSNGYKTFITKPLVEIGDLPITVKMNPESLALFNTYFSSGSAMPVKIEYPDGSKLEFNAVLPKLKINGAKADSSDVSTYEGTIKVSGSVVIS